MTKIVRQPKMNNHQTILNMHPIVIGVGIAIERKQVTVKRVNMHRSRISIYKRKLSFSRTRESRENTDTVSTTGRNPDFEFETIRKKLIATAIPRIEYV